MDINIYLAFAGILLILSVFANQISSKFGIPSLLLFLGLGMFAGIVGHINFTDTGLTNHVGIIALIFILFNGGLLTSWKTAKSGLGRGITLATLGVFITAGCVAAGCYYLLKMPFEIALLLGTIVSSTDAPAVFSLLKMSKVCMGPKVRSLLEFESASNDPAAVLLTTAAMSYALRPKLNFDWLTDFFLEQILLGLGFGLLFGYIARYMLRRIRFSYLGLYPVFSIAIALLAYSLPQILGGSGFLSVYICGIFIGNTAFLYRRSFLRFNDSLNWIMQISIFLILGLLVNPRHLMVLLPSAFKTALVLILIARPLAVFICLFKSRFSYAQQTIIAWAGLKGAVPIILATYPLMQNLPHAQYIFNLVFFLVIISVLVQGTALPVLADWLIPPGKEKK